MTMPPRRLKPTGGRLMSTTHKEEHNEHGQPARPTRPSQVQLCCRLNRAANHVSVGAA